MNINYIEILQLLSTSYTLSWLKSEYLFICQWLGDKRDQAFLVQRNNQQASRWENAVSLT